MILVCVQTLADLKPAHALIAAMAQRVATFALVHEPAWLNAFDGLTCSVGSDARVCMLNPENFDAVVSFSSARRPECHRQLQFINYFNEIGVPTVEVQHALLQEGMRSPGSQAGESQTVAGLVTGYGARHRVRWSGEDGIGYLRPSFESPSDAEENAGFVLISSSFSSCAYGDRERHQFALALIALVAAFPGRQFVWCPDPVDLAQPYANELLAWVAGYALPLLCIEASAPVERLIPRCAAGVSTLSAPLIDFERCRTPTLVFAPQSTAHLVAGLGGAAFSTGPDLVQALARLESEPEAFQLRTGIGPLDEEALWRAILAATATRDLDPNHLAVALRCLSAPHWTEQDAAAADAEHLSAMLERVAEKLGVLHRSTLAYKAKRLVKQLQFLPGARRR